MLVSLLGIVSMQLELELINLSDDINDSNDDLFVRKFDWINVINKNLFIDMSGTECPRF